MWADWSLEDRAFARRVADRACVGARVAGVEFWEASVGTVARPFLRVLMTYFEDDRHAWKTHLNLVARWTLEQMLTGHAPVTEEEFPQRSIPGQMELLWTLRHQRITATEIPDKRPDLVLRFSSGSSLRVWGGAMTSEDPWELNSGPWNEHPWFTMVNTGEALSIWAPDDF